MVCCAAVSKALANVMMCGLPLSAVPALLVRVNFTVPLAAASGSVKSREKLLEMVVLAAGKAKVGVWVVLSAGATTCDSHHMSKPNAHAIIRLHGGPSTPW